MSRLKQRREDKVAIGTRESVMTSFNKADAIIRGFFGYESDGAQLGLKRDDLVQHLETAGINLDFRSITPGTTLGELLRYIESTGD